VYSEALHQGYIEERTFTDLAELRSEKTRMFAMVVAFARQKQERGEARLEELAATEAFGPGVSAQASAEAPDRGPT